MGANRRLSALAIVTAIGCSSAESESTIAPEPAPAPTPICAAANPPPRPPFQPNALCPHVRPPHGVWPKGTQVTPELLVGTYSRCRDHLAIELRYDAERNRITYRKLDDRLVPLVGGGYAEGAIRGWFRLDVCHTGELEPAWCDVTWAEDDNESGLPRRMGVYASPTAVTLSAYHSIPNQEWVRVGD